VIRELSPGVLVIRNLREETGLDATSVETLGDITRATATACSRW